MNGLIRRELRFHIPANIDVVLGMIRQNHGRIRTLPQNPGNDRRCRGTVRMDDLRRKRFEPCHFFLGKRNARAVSVRHRSGVETRIRDHRIGVLRIIRIRVARCSDDNLRIKVALQIICIVHHHVHDAVDDRRERVVQKADLHACPLLCCSACIITCSDQKDENNYAFKKRK